jgi:SAM-dependent methyltransferase
MSGRGGKGGNGGTLVQDSRPGIDWQGVYTTRAAEPAKRPELLAEPLARNGYALLDDIETPRVRGLLGEMERFQSSFMAATRPLWAEGYKHTGDRLDNWSRRWEYPYCAWNLRDLPPGRVLDAGSGINFFPFWMAQQGWQVTAADVNAGLAPLYDRANEALGSAVRFETAPIERLPFADGSFDAVYCVSVLEHAPHRAAAMHEFARVLAPGGRLTITWDVSLSRDCDVKLEDVAVLLAGLEKRFAPVHPLDLLRPSNLLTTERMLAGERWRLSWRPHRAWWRRAISQLRHGDPFRTLAVMGTTWTKRG